ncbi:hypothetical protein BDV97DRAFT_365996 [Delphinella strobiligena]|nr:hypothetical protein BDV97DRAFT_365996 [Delphinella strobiligena]
MPAPAPIPTFFLYRSAAGSNEAYDPTTIQFYPPKDSDELFDALRVAYPNAKTHSDRMRDAVIDFLVKERDTEQAKTIQTAPTPSTWSWPSHSSSSSAFSSPDLIDLATPASTTSPMPAMSRQASRSSAGRSSMEQMTGVFSLSTSSQPKTRVRRKMTESEKAEYRKRRIVKACDKCSKRKRKCQHNQEKIEVLAPSSDKVTKRKSPPNNTSSFRQSEGTPPPSSAFPDNLDPFSFLTDDSLFSIDSDFQQGASADLRLIDFDLEPQTAQTGAWPWSHTPDWTLLDTQPTHYQAQPEPLFGEFTSFTNAHVQPQHRQQYTPTENHSLTPDVSNDQQAQNHTWFIHEQLGDGIMPHLSGSTQALLSGNPNVLSQDDGPMPPPPILSTNDYRTETGPTRSKRHNGGFDRSAFIGNSQTSPSMDPIALVTHSGEGHLLRNPSTSGGANRTSAQALQQTPRRDTPEVSKRNPHSIRHKAATPSGSGDSGFVVNDPAQAIGGGWFQSEESRPGHNGRQNATLQGTLQGASLGGEGAVKNKGAQHASRKSASPAGLHDTILPLNRSNCGRTQPELASSSNVLPAYYTSAEQVPAQRAPMFDVASSSRLRVGHISSALLDGPESAMANAKSSPSLTMSSGAVRASTSARSSSSEPSASLAHARVHSRSHKPWSSLASGSDCSGSSLAEALPMSAIDLVQAPSTEKVRNLAQRGGSRPDGSAALTFSTEARRITGRSAYAPHNPCQTAMHVLGTAESIPQAMTTQSASKVSTDIASRPLEVTRTKTPQVSGSNVTSTYSSISPTLSRRKRAPISVSLSSSRTSTAVASRPAGLIAHLKLKHELPDGDTPTEISLRLSEALPSSMPATHGKPSQAARSPLTNMKPAFSSALCSTASAPIDTNARTSPTATASKADVDVHQAALVVISVVSSGYLLRLASALTSELLRSLDKRPEDRSCRGLGGDEMRGPWLVGCV